MKVKSEGRMKLVNHVRPFHIEIVPDVESSFMDFHSRFGPRGMRVILP